VYKEQLMALGLGTFLGDPDSTTKAFTDLKMELDKEKVAQEKAQTEVDMLTRQSKIERSPLTILLLKSPPWKRRLIT
jgi:hypothetical protein